MKSTAKPGPCRSAACWKPPPARGPSIGWRFEQLAAILAGVQNPDRLGVCFDTCHVFAAGYPLDAGAAIGRPCKSLTAWSASGKSAPFI